MRLVTEMRKFCRRAAEKAAGDRAAIIGNI